MSSDKRRSSFYLVISILVAVGIWVYVDLTQGITASKEVYNIPIEFQGEDTTLAERGLMLLADSETTIDLKLEGAKLILAQLDTSKLRVQADLSAVTEVVFANTEDLKKGGVYVLAESADGFVLGETPPALAGLPAGPWRLEVYGKTLRLAYPASTAIILR